MPRAYIARVPCQPHDADRSSSAHGPEPLELLLDDELDARADLDVPSVPAELLAVFGDLTCATSIGVEGGWRATLVTASTTTLTSGSCMALRRLGGSLIMAEHQDGPNALILSYLLTSSKPA